MAEPVGGQGEELAVVWQSHQQLGDRERDQLGVGDLRRSTGSAPRRQEIVDEDVSCRQKVVESGVHEATSVVDVALDNA